MSVPSMRTVVAVLPLTIALAVVLALIPTTGAAATSHCPSGTIALTFDDGPGEHTPAVLDALADKEVLAAFFVLGRNVDGSPSLVARAADEGHEIANHSYTHRDLEDLEEDEIREEVLRTDQAIRDAGAEPLPLLRPPFGHWDGPGGTVATAAASVGYGIVTWTYSPTDYLADADTIRARVLDNLHPDAIILLHDGSSNAPEMIAALPAIIDGARDQGYCFGVLDDDGGVVPPAPPAVEEPDRPDEGDHPAAPVVTGHPLWLLRDALAGGAADHRFTYGRPGDVVLRCDWNGDGRDTPAIVREGTWHLRDRLAGGVADHSFVYGRVDRGDLPICGDWNGDGRDTPGIVREGTWHLRDRLAGGVADHSFVYGRVDRGDLPLAGDWNGDGRDTPGIVREGTWHLRDRLAGGVADHSFVYGRVDRGDLPLAGDWNGDGRDTPAIVREGTWHLRDRLAGGVADHSFVYGRVDRGDLPSAVTGTAMVVTRRGSCVPATEPGRRALPGSRPSPSAGPAAPQPS
jgi:peptidoglycan/xylan/chitin deacetylase (PgdA/CDA1 family)